ncbi:hypothetical protein [Bradyrhizobium sp. UFLA03-84]|uniref:metallophosphoesterase family protein n=1 Tax=Bradyrhizobium sp. UFLA03-84 TaxID=418599 RepID=UPI001FD9E5CF|nr:hypothetical protein [Bradyrhizobium sp. UFLA03-84]
MIYADACSGVAGALHERTFASVNDVVRRLHPAPEFILFPGDEIIGLTADAEALRAQWRHWLDTEMGWLDRRAVPLWHTTGNHTTYDEMSEAVFREVLKLPHNGPPGHEGLSYWVRRDDLLMVFVHTLWSGLGGEGHVETDWLGAVLEQHKDATYKLVLGHHPVYPINGFSGSYQREIGHEYSALLGYPGPRRRDRLCLQPHPRFRRPGPSRGAADLHRRRRHRAPDARGRRVSALRAGRARSARSPLSGARHRRRHPRAARMAAAVFRAGGVVAIAARDQPCAIVQDTGAGDGRRPEIVRPHRRRSSGAANAALHAGA